MAKCPFCGKEFEFPNYLMLTGTSSKGRDLVPTCPYCSLNLNEGKKEKPDARGRAEKLVGGKIE